MRVELLPARPVDDQFLEPGTDVFRDAHRASERGALEDHHELLAAKAGDEVAGPEPLSKQVRKRTQDCVTGLVAVNLVEVSEMVEIEDQRGRRRLTAKAPPAGQDEVEARVEVPAVVEAGQAVVDGQFGDLFLDWALASASR
jgi:hypothetical protein